ncbi:Ig-like domain-containing protein [Nocardioides sp. GXZ039]|uniref:Ig-like domain-containing protein n=1 Tax=Nocardioides sp. GXZ039 TaxID=3136018 RepID=UPI0030F38B8F
MNRKTRRGLSAVTSLAVAAAGLALGVTSAGPAQAEEAAGTAVTDATFTWGLNGYAQQGIFGPWTYKDLSGNAEQLTGSTSGGSQTEYAVEPAPATSMPVSSPQKTPNAIRFTEGTGTADPATGAATIAWDGSYTVNAYPASFNAPNEIYSDPELSIDAEGNGELTMDFTLGPGVDLNGNPTPAQSLGRIPILEFDAGSAAATSTDSYRYTPAYQGVTVDVPDAPQTTTCTTDGGATGWWGAWPEEFVTSVPASVRPHFYSTGCGGYNDLKPALPVDVNLNLVPSVTVSDTRLLPHGTQEVTVTGRNFDPSLATGTRPPFAGQKSGLYIAFGRYAEVWRPSEGAPSTSRVNPAGANGNGVAVKWAVPAASFAGSSPVQDPASATYTELRPDGSFSTTIKVDQSWLSSAGGNFGIYTYAGGGPTVAAYETYTPIAFAKATPTVAVSAGKVSYGKGATATVVVGAEGGTVTLKRGSATVGTAAVVDGRASFALGTLPAGAHSLTAAYSGTDNYLAASAGTTLTVAKATSKTTAKLTKAPTRTKAGKAKVTVSSPTTKPSGKVTVVIKKGAKVLKRVKGTLNRNGVVSVNLPKLGKKAKGAHQVVVTYAGNGNVAGSKQTLRFKVR